MGKCSECDWWVQKYENGYLATPDFVKKNFRYCRCPKISWLDDLDNAQNDVAKYAEDGQDSGFGDPVFVTGKNFGCIHFKKVKS